MATRTDVRAGLAPVLNMVRWSAVFAGVVIGLATFVMLSLLWQALAVDSTVDFFTNNLEWWLGASAIFATFVGGLLAAWISGTNGMAQGILHGLTVWGLIVVFSLLLTGPALALQGIELNQLTTAEIGTSGLWTAFWSTLIAFGSAGLGGLIGGFMPHPAGARVGYGDRTYARDYDEAGLTEEPIEQRTRRA